MIDPGQSKSSTLKLPDGPRTEAVASHVYVLKSRSCDLVKIGKANSVLERVKAFGIESIDISCSYALCLKSAQDAVHLEKTLHRTFRKWAVSKSEALDKGVGRDGATEWFSGDCLDRLREYLVSNADLLGFTMLPSSVLLAVIQEHMDYRVALNQRRRQLNSLQFREQQAADIRRRARETRIAASKAEVKRRCEELACLMKARMQAVEANVDAMFVGCASPCEGSFQLLFFFRSSFAMEGRESAWLDMNESDVCVDRCYRRLITSWARTERGDLTLEQVNVTFPLVGSSEDVFANQQFRDFIEEIQACPIDDRFFSLSARDAFNLGEDLLRTKRVKNRSSGKNTPLQVGHALSLFDEGTSLQEIVDVQSAELRFFGRAEEIQARSS